MFAQRATGVLIQCLYIIGHLRARNDAKVFDHLEGEATGQPVQLFVPAQRQKRLKQGGNFAINEMLQATFNLLRHIGTGFVVNKSGHSRLQRISARHQLAHRLGAPHQATLLSEINFGIGCIVEAIGAQRKMRRQCLQAGLTQRLGLLTACVFILTETEPFQTTDEFAFDGHFTLIIYFGQKGLLLLEPAQKHGCAPVHKSLGQTLVQRIRQSVFYSASLAAPMTFVIYPAGSLCDIGPRADK